MILMVNLQERPKERTIVKLPELPSMAGLGRKVRNFLNIFRPATPTQTLTPPAITAELIQANHNLEEKLKEQNRRETELRRSNEELQQALEKEKNLNDLKTKLLSMASHEFRTPLTTVIMATDMLETFGNTLTSKQKVNFLSRIKVATELMTELMDEVLQYNRIDAGVETLELEEVDLGRFCADLVDEIRLISDHDHDLIFQMDPAVAGEIYEADPHFLRQILSNLLSNAVKYSPRGGSVKLILNTGDGQVSFRVEDEGLGIPKGDLEYLFDAFKRGSNVRAIKGTGLGLAIVKKYVEMYKGEIRVESEINRGSAFNVSLPLARCGVKNFAFSRVNLN